MRNSIYDALEIGASSSVATMQAAVRAVVRRFWAVPRDASGDSEEAVRFAALAAAILGNTTRRKDYDVALNPGVGSGPWRLPIGGRDTAGGDGSTHSRELGESADVSQLSVDATVPGALPGVDALAAPLPDGKGWQSPLLWLAVALALLLLGFACVRVLVDGAHWDLMPSLVASLALAVGLFAVALWLGRVREPAAPVASLSRLAIIKWRREGSIFIGLPPPQHDTAWIFKLRLMELTRSAAGFVTAINPWRRLLARLVDYSLLALLLYGVIALVEAWLPVNDIWFAALRSPLLFPMIVVLLAVPIEATMLRTWRSTPGKWLLSMVVVLGASRPADQVQPGTAQLSWARSLRAAWAGASLGLWPVTLARAAGNLRAARDRETVWDASGDSIVMMRPLAVAAVATAMMLLTATALMLGGAWYRDVQTVWLPLAAAATHAGSGLSGPIGGDREPSLVDAARPQAAVVAAPPTVAPAASLPPAAVAVTQPPPPSLTESEMAKQADAAHARRLRIDAFARQADAAHRSGDYGMLLGACRQWTQEQPGSAEAWRCYGLAQFQNGAGRDALPALRQALKLEPNDSQVEAAILRILRP